MIELPSLYGPGNATAEVIDFGFIQRGALGAKASRINRPGNRHAVTFSFGPFRPDVARQFVALLMAARYETLRVPFPLQWAQGSPGALVVDGADQEGTTINLRSGNAGYACKQGYWLSIENAAGQHFLHNAKELARVDASGDMALTLSPPLRHPFADGAAVHIGKPYIEGLVTDEVQSWNYSVDHATPINFTVEEAE